MPRPGEMIYGAGECAVCEHRVKAGYLMCSDHWYQVPAQLRTDVYNALEAWQAGVIDLEALQTVQESAVKAVTNAV